MKKEEISDSQSKLNVLTETSWEENPAIQWLSQHSKQLIWGILGALLLLILIVRLIVGSERESETSYLNADRAFSQFVTASVDPEEARDALAKLQAIMAKLPELHAKYDGLIAQTLINRGEIQDALNYALPVIERTSHEDRPFYTNYAEATLLIGEQKYAEALRKAEQLQVEMSTAKQNYGPTLFAFNLLRIGMLQQQLGLKNEEKQTWDQWQQMVNREEEGNTSPAFAKHSRYFQEGKASINDYIESRKVALEKS